MLNCHTGTGCGCWVKLPRVQPGVTQPKKSALQASRPRDNAGRQLRRQRSTVYRKRPSKRKTRPYLLETERASQLSNTSGSVFNVQSKRGPWDSDHVWTKENKDELAKEVPGLDDALVAAKYDVFVKEGQLDGALEVVSLATSANRKKVLNRLFQKSFLRLAMQRGAVKSAFEFVKMLPDGVVDVRTYNLLISVCAKARDHMSALLVKEMMTKNGHQLDTVLYTNLISACARAREVDQAFRLYGEMKAADQKPDQKVYGALCQACASTLQGARDKNRRLQLVLMERAFSVMEDMVQDGFQPDPVLWNTLITCTSRASQLQRCFEVLQRMQEGSCIPDTYTYSSLLEACHRNGENDLALRVYKRAQNEDVPQSIVLFTIATLCCASSEEANLDTALEIYNDVQRKGVDPDSKYFSALMEVAGRCGKLDVAFALQEEMEAHGIEACTDSCSALISACLWVGDVNRACEVYKYMTKKYVYPNMSEINRLIIACGANHRMGDILIFVEDAVRLGCVLDITTYTAIICACQRADEPELAFAVADELHRHKFQVDEIVCYSLLKICYNTLANTWYKGKNISCISDTLQIKPTPIGPSLVQVLSGSESDPIEALECPKTSEIIDRALTVYRDLLNESIQPSMKILNRLLACLRLPHVDRFQATIPAPTLPRATDYLHVDVRMAKLHIGDLPNKLSRDNVKYFDQRAIPILKEAIRLGVISQFSLDGDLEIDMRNMMPGVAEVYTLAVITELQRRSSLFKNKLKFTVPLFDPKKVMLPSHFEWVDGAQPTTIVGNDDTHDSELDDSTESFDSDEDELPSATASTSLGVLAMLRRLKLWCRVDCHEYSSTISIPPVVIAQWTRKQRNKNRLTRRMNKRFAYTRDATGREAKYQDWADLSTPIGNQQRDIRAGW